MAHETPTALEPGDAVWDGDASLRASLVPVADLEPFPDNYRVGDTRAIAASLRRFGQMKPIVIDGNRIVAGHHIVKAATEELGWSHVAAVNHHFGSEDEQRAFLLADNRTSELGYHDDQLLAGHLKALAEIDALQGTGYTHDDLDNLLAGIAALDTDPPDENTRTVTFKVRDRDEQELVLLFSEQKLAEVERWLEIIGKETGAEGASERAYHAFKIAAQQLNKG